jgi:hypothetical protein
MVSLCNMHYSEIYDMFRPCKWAIIRLLVESMGRLYTKGLGGTSLPIGSTNNLMMAHLKGRNMSYIAL